MRKISPTRAQDPQRRRKRPDQACRREKPDIYVRAPRPGTYSGLAFVQAHLRNKRGYVYLCWREGQTVRTFYLGKAPRSCPTAAAGRSSRSAPAPDPDRRAKNGSKNRATML